MALKLAISEFALFNFIQVIVELGTGYFSEKSVSSALELIDRKVRMPNFDLSFWLTVYIHFNSCRIILWLSRLKALKM